LSAFLFGAGSIQYLATRQAVVSQVLAQQKLSPADLFTRFASSVGRVVATNINGVAVSAREEATCFVITKDGYALTVAYLFTRQATQAKISLGASPTPVLGVLVAKDDSTSLALIKLPQQEVEYTPVKIAHREVTIGEELFLLGNGAQGNLALMR
jgi:S1-C subfamily serine protease